MSLRYTGAWLQDGAFNPLTAPTGITLYDLYGWGRNDLGQLGVGNSTNYSSPKQAGSATSWLTISSGYTYASATKSNGTLWSWGFNSSGQLGLGNTTTYLSPKQVGALTGWLKLSCGNYHTLAIKTDGTLWSWGNNSAGQLGLGNTTSYSSPKQIGSLVNWASIAARFNSSFAIKTDGTLWSWGRNGSAELGLGDSGVGTNRSSPVQVGALTNWSKIFTASISLFTVAIKTDGTIWSWGSNLNGRLGLGNTTNYSSPKQIGALTNWLTFSSGYFHTVATKTDGTLWSWGASATYGALGLGNTTNYSSPKQIGSLTNWLSVSCGAYFTTSIKTDGTLWSWGDARLGRLGLGNTTPYSSPKQVGALTSWAVTSSGAEFTNATQI